MKMKRIPVVVAVLCLLAILGFVLLPRFGGAPALAANPPALTAPQDYPGVDVLLEPPTSTAKVSAEEALGIAARQWPAAKAYTAVLADYTKTIIQEDNGYLIDGVTAWVVTADGVCVPIIGNPAYADECAGTTMNIVVDASTGEWISSFSQQTEEG